MFGRLLGWYTIYTFWGLLPPNRILSGAKFTLQNSLCVQVLRSAILAVLLHGTRAVGVSQTLRRGSLQGMELRNFRSSSFSTKGATYIPRAAVTLGIGPHSIYLYSNFVC